MKKLIYTFAFIAGLFHTGSLAADNIYDSISMGGGYANDIFYSMENGVIKSEPGNNWEIAFYTATMSAGISINDGLSLVLYTYPEDDTAGWHSVDVSNIESWTPMYNSDKSWEEGAFTRNALGHPDYGWGIYNMANHNVVGDSIYVIQLADERLKKLWIQRKQSTTNTYYFKYANIDGSDEVSEVLEVNDYLDKMFVYYSLTEQQVIDREPPMNEWDILFSRYMGTTFDPDGNPTPYLVTGVLNGAETGANVFHPVEEDYEDWEAAPMLYERSPIGHDWKTFNMETFEWQIQDELAYFVQTRDDEVYKLVFDYFDGMASGEIGFMKKKITYASLDTPFQISNAFRLAPNPATNFVRIHKDMEVQSQSRLMVFDRHGRMLVDKNLTPNQLTHEISIDHLTPGLYLVQWLVNDQRFTEKLIVKRSL